METEAIILEDSISAAGNRLTTVVATFPRNILAEMNTSRVFSRSSASSRAIPVKKQLEKILAEPYTPFEYRYNQPGMQPGDLMDDEDAYKAREAILSLRDSAADTVAYLNSLGPRSPVTGEPVGLHKQWANRYLEPWMWHVAIISSTEWTNFKLQRAGRHSPLAQKEFRDIADAIIDGIDASTPTYVAEGDWHTPFINPEERGVGGLAVYDQSSGDGVGPRLKCSAARSARVSYLNHEGIKSLADDFKLYDRLTTERPMHAAPLEHVATPDPSNAVNAPLKNVFGDVTGYVGPLPILGNFCGWRQLRHSVTPTYGHV